MTQINFPEIQNILSEEEMSSFKFDSNSQADRMVSESKELKGEMERLSEIYNERLEQFKLEYENKISKLEKKKDWIDYNLMNYAKQSNNLKETKTQFKLSMVSGDIVVKKSMPKMIKPTIDEKIIKEKFADYKKEKVELDWKEFKKNLTEKKIGDQWFVIDKSTGEIIEEVQVEITPERVEVK